MSDNVRTALYDADYSCTLANRASSSSRGGTRVVGKHCESGDIVVMDEYLPADVAPGDLIAVPGTGAYCRALSSQYNHTPRPPVVAVTDGQRGSSCAARPSRTCWRWTSDRSGMMVSVTGERT
jgi:diaminopimelate decarboxylase